MLRRHGERKECYVIYSADPNDSPPAASQTASPGWIQSRLESIACNISFKLADFTFKYENGDALATFSINVRDQITQLAQFECVALRHTSLAVQWCILTAPRAVCASVAGHLIRTAQGWLGGRFSGATR